MEGKLCILFLFVIITISVLRAQTLSGPNHGKTVMCYVPNWVVYRVGDGQFQQSDIDPSLCTHLVYAFAGLDAETFNVKSLDPWQDLEDNYGKAGYKRMVGLKEKYPHLKIIISIGGWNEGSEKFSNMVRSEDTRSTFVQNVLNFLTAYKFDGIDLHWKYPALRGGKPEDKANYVLLMKMLKEAFSSRGYLLVAAVGTDKYTMDSSYNFSKLNQYLNFIVMMCYDYHGPWDKFIGANAPLRGINNQDIRSVESTILYLLGQGVSPNKMILGVPFYGRTFTLVDPATEGLSFGKTATEPVGFAGPLTKENAYYGYHEICKELADKASTWQTYWHDKAAIPYMRDGRRVITYDNTRSIAAKVKLGIDYGLRGFMVWSTDTDDFKGLCPPEEDTYLDFIDRYNTIVADPAGIRRAIKTLDLPDETSPNSGYLVSGNRMLFRVPKRNIFNYPLLRTVNDATTLAIEEKRIVKEIARARKKLEDDFDERASRHEN